MLKRVLTAAVLMPLIVILVYWGPSLAVAVVAAAVALIALAEFFGLTAQMGLHAFRNWTFICTVALFFAQRSAGSVDIRHVASNYELIHGPRGILASADVMLVIFLLGAALLGVASRKPLADVLPGISASAAGLLMIAWPFSYLARMDSRPRVGPVLVLFTLALVWAGDTLAYFVGKSMGRVRMAPALSPKKTWEGAVGNIIGSLIVGYFFARWQGGELAPWLITAALANVAGQVGDLIESAYKRGAGVKDSGSLLPGHGGMLDRIDSLILAAPVVWLAASWLIGNRL
jgi:phosphatidate cytidylyltransferase